MLSSLGFTIHPEESLLKPTESLIYLGFITEIDRREKQKIYVFCAKLLGKS